MKKKTKKVKEIKLPMEFIPGKMKYEPILPANKSKGNDLKKVVKADWWWLIFGLILLLMVIYFITTNI